MGSVHVLQNTATHCLNVMLLAKLTTLQSGGEWLAAETSAKRTCTGSWGLEIFHYGETNGFLRELLKIFFHIKKGSTGKLGKFGETTIGMMSLLKG